MELRFWSNVFVAVIVLSGMYIDFSNGDKSQKLIKRNGTLL